ncbi:MAG: phosphate/phosphite/phosphonate ABC transporter substrate-binding protein, partial [Chlorobiales bacterium]|nr:phosphate/phosphite/phosphonate ABC transporter substrate-binding protein [Chlorobiales bacterium]
MADYVAERLGAYGIASGEVRIARDIPGLVALFREGRVDIYMDSPYPAMMVHARTDTTPILRRWKNGVAEYGSVIFALKDGGIAELGDIRGKIVALEERASTSGFMLPVAHIRKSGLGLTRIRHLSEALSPANINWIFSGDDQNTVQWVLAGKAHAGAIGSHQYHGLPPEALEGFRVVAETAMVPRQIVIARNGLGDGAIRAVREILAAMESDPAGRRVLRKLKKT